MKTVIPWMALLVAFVGFRPTIAAEAVPADERLKPGLVYVFFDDPGFQRPGSHGVQASVKDHGVATAVKSHGVDPRVDLQIEGIAGFSRLWLGYVRFPQGGEVTIRAEVDNGMRLYLGR